MYCLGWLKGFNELIHVQWIEQLWAGSGMLGTLTTGSEGSPDLQRLRISNFPGVNISITVNFKLQM